MPFVAGLVDLCYTGAVSLADLWMRRPGGEGAGGCGPGRQPGTGDEETLARKAAGDSMGKYKQWLHHQEIGRRLRDQISTLEQERARVQKMAPSHATALPELDNPIISALLSYTKSGNKLSNIDPIKAAMPPMDPNLDRSRPATSTATATTGGAKANPASDQKVVASLLARAEQMPSDPLDQMRELARAQDDGAAKPTPPGAGPLPPVDSVGGWWQRQKTDDQD